MDFGAVIAGLKAGKRYARAGWNGTVVKVFIFLVPGSRFETNREPLKSILGAGVPISYAPHIDVYVDGEAQPWPPTQGDMLAEDWEEVG